MGVFDLSHKDAQDRDYWRLKIQRKQCLYIQHLLPNIINECVFVYLYLRFTRNIAIKMACKLCMCVSFIHNASVIWVHWH